MPSPMDPIRRRMRAATTEAVTLITEDLLGKAQRDAPIAEGTLRASGEAEVHQLPDGVEGTVSFNTIYAAAQHEGLDFAHPKGGKARYLQDPLLEGAARYQRIIALAQAKALG